MDFRILGSLEAVAAGAAADLGPPKQRALLAILIVHAGEIVPTDRLIDLLWGDEPPRTASHSIQIYISDLRKSLERLADQRLIVTRHPGYQLLAERVSIDAVQFERLVSEGARRLSAGDPEGGAAILRSALRLWRGPALSDFVYEEFAQPYIRRFHDLHLDAIEELAAAELEAGRPNEALPLLDAAIRDDPLRERSRELQMLALYRTGRHAEALRSYQTLRQLLDQELDLEPSPVLRQLQERILLHDQSLTGDAVEDRASGLARNPYKGLRPFVEADAADFFGREALLDRLIATLRDGARLIALVGPSGSGKSSVVAAGLIPRLREGALPGSDQWVIAPMVPGARPFEDVETAISHAAQVPVGLAPLLDQVDRSGQAGPALRAMPVDGRLVLIVDQFEDVFTVTDDAPRRQFLDALGTAVREPDGQLVVVLVLRADHYDKPLLHPSFAALFIPAVINVLPMTAHELEAAVIQPAAGVGVAVEPALLAELVAATADQAGALPLLQFALTELFEQRHDATLTLAGYRDLGGLHGILSRRAERLYGDLSVEEQRATMQVYLRLVRLGHGTADLRRRLPLSELTDLDVDPVDLSTVLRTFGNQRLLSFDRDPISGGAIVEVAHDALLVEWERLANWIDRHRLALRRHETLTAAVGEWESSARDPDYLLAGSRLNEFETWRREGSLRLTGREREYLDAGVNRRSQQEAAEAARLDAHRRLERRARARLVALAIAIVMLGASLVAGVLAVGTAGRAVPRVALLYGGSGPVDQYIEDGFDRAVSEFGMVGVERLFFDVDQGVEELGRLSDEGVGLIVVPYEVDGSDAIIAAHPGTRYMLPFESERPNVTMTDVADEEGAFLAGAAAALKTRTRTIGFVGGMDHPVNWSFEAGYRAGARTIDPSVRVVSTYLAEYPDVKGAFGDPLAAREAARLMYDGGADVVFHAAGGSGVGVFAAADELSRSGRHLWAIGVDTDQYEAVRALTGVVNPDAWREHILTSVVKRIDIAVYSVLKEFAHGEFRSGRRMFDLASNGVELSTSGGYIDDIQPRIEELRQQIVSGAIDVPCIPSDKVEAARAMGFTRTGCVVP